MFTTQIYGTILGGFVNYAIMITIVNGNRDLLVDGNGNASWSGATIQSYNTNAASWALAKYLYKAGAEYEMVSIGLAIGAGVVALHRIFVYVSLIAPTSPLITPNHSLSFYSSSPKSETLILQISTWPSLFNMRDTSRTMRPRLAFS